MLKQDDPPSLQKLPREGQLDKQKTCIGWDIQTCSLRVSVTKEKVTAWVQDIRASLSSTKIKTDKLESLIGKLNHVEHIISSARYFLTRLRQHLKRGNKWVPQHLQYWHRQDLHFWIKILQWNTYKGLPINNRVFVTPPVALWPDTCEYGVLGYN